MCGACAGVPLGRLALPYVAPNTVCACHLTLAAPPAAPFLCPVGVRGPAGLLPPRHRHPHGCRLLHCQRAAKREGGGFYCCGWAWESSPVKQVLAAILASRPSNPPHPGGLPSFAAVPDSWTPCWLSMPLPVLSSPPSPTAVPLCGTLAGLQCSPRHASHPLLLPTVCPTCRPSSRWHPLWQPSLSTWSRWPGTCSAPSCATGRRGCASWRRRRWQVRRRRRRPGRAGGLVGP